MVLTAASGSLGGCASSESGSGVGPGSGVGLGSLSHFRAYSSADRGGTWVLALASVGFVSVFLTVLRLGRLRPEAFGRDIFVSFSFYRKKK